MKIRSILFLVFLMLGAAPAVAASTNESSVLKHASFTLSGYHIDQPYASMEGPIGRAEVALAPHSKSPRLWIKSISLEVLDKDGKPLSPQYLCHAWATIPPLPGEKDAGLLTISAGLMTMDFPKGYAMVVANTAQSKIKLLAQAENSAGDGGDNLDLLMKFKITYIEDDDAIRLGLRPLVATSVNTVVPESIIDHEHMGEEHTHAMNNMGEHFYVPPGRHVYRSDVPETADFYRDGTIQYIKMHLHPYGQSVELRDKTEQKTVWKGSARNVPGKAVLAWTDHYAGGGEGLKIYSNHVYEVITTYNNTTRKRIDAMGFLRIYFEASSPQAVP